MEQNLILLILTVILTQTSLLTVISFSKLSFRKNSIIIDTNVLIDGRILPIARSGIIGSTLLVPTSVVRELQFMADKADHDKRERARFGLENIEKLQELEGVVLKIINDGQTNKNGVDEQLIDLAKKWQAKLCTVDYNLNKSARVQSVEVVNINEIAHALRVAFLPGENFKINLVQPGQENGQAIGYLDDGTMVVVDNAKKMIGQEVSVEATRVLQTAAGKMMFAKYISQNKSSKKSNTNKTPTGKRPNKRIIRQSSEDRLVDLANR